MVKSVMVPVDASPFAESALRYALALVRAANARLHVVLVHETPALVERATTLGSELLEPQQRQAEEEYLGALVERLSTEDGTAAERSLLTGVPASALAEFARRRNIDLIVMSTHGRGPFNRLWLGSVADGLIRRSRVPVLLVRPTDSGAAPTAAPDRRVLVAVDGSEAGEIALAFGAQLCRLTGAACTVIRVVVPPAHVITSRIPDTARMVREKTEQASHQAEQYLRSVSARVGTLPDSTRTEVVTGTDVATAILRCAETEGADLIAIGTRGHGGAARMVLGSVADKVIRGSPVPVLVCPAPKR